MQKLVENKLKFLSLRQKGLTKILNLRDLASLEKQLKQWNDELDELSDLEITGQKTQIEAGKDTQEIEEWSLRIEENTDKYKNAVMRLRNGYVKLKKRRSTAKKRRRKSQMRNINERENDKCRNWSCKK